MLKIEKEKMTNLQQKIVRNADVLSAPVQEELVMFDVEAGRYFSLNEMASAIWRRLEAPVTIEALCAEMQETFDVSPERCREDLTAFVSKLEAKGLVRRLGPER
jgi:hypothetical protein